MTFHASPALFESRVDCRTAGRESFGKPFKNLSVQGLALPDLPMKFLRRAICALFVATYAARAATPTPDEQDAATFGDYAPTIDDDLVIYIPKYTVKLGFRGISGVKSSFGGQGVLSSTHDIGEDSTGVRGRLYHDGYVALDNRTVTDPAGNSVPISPDGRTNTWKITDASQVNNDAGTIEMHTYEATLTETGYHEKDPGLGLGVELALERDMGQLFGSRVKWGVIGGMSVNQFSAITSSQVEARVLTTTDSYSLYGQTIIDPSAGYTSPATTGSDPTILLGNTVLERLPSTVTSTDFVTTAWKLRGAYMTFRAGPTLFVPIGSRFSASISAGAVLVYAGSSYDVNQTFKPETGDTITQSTTGLKGTLLPGYYIDASLQFSINDTSGLYLGAVYQSSGNYTQSITSADEKATYVSKIDLSSLQGIRAGVNFRF